LASLFDRLARFCSDIGDIGRGGDSQDSGESAEHEPTPEILSVAMMAAGQQLIEALNQEREQGSRSSSEEDPLVAAAHWQEARKRVELARQEYDAALRRYRDAMLQSPEPPQRTVPRRTMLVLEDAPAVAGCIPKESRS
jgi:hypothetical protein